MDDARDEPHGHDDPAAAFDRLRGEVSFLRSAIEGMAAREAVEIPDYEPTLARTERVLTVLTEQLEPIVESPALTLTPHRMASEIASASISARQEDQRLIAEARTALAQAVRDIGNRLVSARYAGEQKWWLIGTGAVALLLGMVLWAGFAGIVARAVPASWQWPERMAARSVDMSMWAAGQDLMASANPNAWDGIVIGDAIVRANRAAIEACRKVAAKAKKPVRCTIEVEGEGQP